MLDKVRDIYRENKFIIYLFLIAFLLRVGVVLTIHTPIISDFKTMYDASIELLNHTDSYKNSSYFLLWGYQMGHVIYQSLLLHIINSVTFLKIMNALITSFSVVLIYLLCRKVSKEKYAKMMSIFYMIFPFPLLLNTVLTNQLLPVTLTLLGIYLLVGLDYKNKYIHKSIIIGLLIGLANILRSEGIVILFGIFLYSFLLLIQRYDWKKIICSFLLIAVSYFSIFQVTSYVLEKTNISPNGLNNGNTTWKFVLGFNYETNGMYSEEDASIYAGFSEKSKEIVRERLQEYQNIPMLFIKKIKIQWINSDLSWSIGHIENRKLYHVFNTINQIFIIVLLLLAVVGAYCILRYQFFIIDKVNRTSLIAFMILFTYFGVYLLIEVMPRYAYSLQIFEVILASIGLEFICDNLLKKQLSKKE